MLHIVVTASPRPCLPDMRLAFADALVVVSFSALHFFSQFFLSLINFFLNLKYGRKMVLHCTDETDLVNLVLALFTFAGHDEDKVVAHLSTFYHVTVNCCTTWMS